MRPDLEMFVVPIHHLCGSGYNPQSENKIRIDILLYLHHLFLLL